MDDLKESVSEEKKGPDTGLILFFRLLLEVDRRVNPDLYTRSPVAGSDPKQEGKKETQAV